MVEGGNDTFIGGAGGDYFFGGSGRDMVSYENRFLLDLSQSNWVARCRC